MVSEQGDQIHHIKKSFNKVLDKLSQKDIYVFAGMGLAKQNIDPGSFNSGFNYPLADFQKDIFKPGYFAGFRIDGTHDKQYQYSVAFSLNRVSTGTKIVDGIKIGPFVGDFIAMKPEDQFLFFSISPHYKKLLHLTDTSKFKFYLVFGPSIDWRLSDQSLDNQINDNYNHFQLKADIGLEFDNKTYYTLFLHYKKGLTSITKSPINSSFNMFELGLMLKAKDIF